MLFYGFRISKAFTLFVVSVAIFTDIMLLGLVAPVLPLALSERVGIPGEAVQKWNSVLLAAYGAALMIGSCT